MQLYPADKVEELGRKGLIKDKLFPEANITDAKTDYEAGDLDSEAEIITALNSTNTTINEILAALESLGFVRSS